MVKYNIPPPIPIKDESVITETKVITKEPGKIQTEEESQIEHTKEQQKKFFDEDDEILEVNFD